MKRIFPIRIFTVMILILTGLSCTTPTTKDDFINKFENFIRNVKADVKNYNRNDWKWADTRFEKFRTTWYEQFKDELSVDEKLKVAGLVMEYEAVKGNDKLRNLFDREIKKEIEGAKKEVKEYFDKDFSKDLDKVIDGAKEIGDSALKVFDDIARELKKKQKNDN